MKRCLVVIDMQNDFITGSLRNEEGIKIVPLVVERVKEALKDNREDLIFTKDTHDDNYLKTQEGTKLPIKHCIKDTWGHDICDELKPFVEYAKVVVNKNSFGYKDLPLYISQYEKVTLVGLCTDICVISNAMLIKAFYPEIKIEIEAKYCAGVTPKAHEIALQAMQNCQFDIIK